MNTKPRLTNWNNDDNSRWSLTHRLIGIKCPMTNMDAIEYDFNHKILFMADYKVDPDKKSPDYSPNRETLNLTEKSSYIVQRMIADKFEVPYFVIIAYLEDYHATHMYYVCPANCFAVQYAKANWDHKSPEYGKWFSVLGFCKWRHHIRKEPFNKFEIISKKHDKYNIYHATTLGELPDHYQQYGEPNISLPLDIYQ